MLGECGGPVGDKVQNYAWLAGWAARRVGTVSRAMRWLDRAAGLMFVGFGLRLAMSDNP